MFARIGPNDYNKEERDTIDCQSSSKPIRMKHIPTLGTYQNTTMIDTTFKISSFGSANGKMPVKNHNDSSVNIGKETMDTASLCHSTNHRTTQ